MNQSKIKTILSNFTFRKAIWLAPLTFLIHLIEEIVFGFWYMYPATTFTFFIIFNLILMGLYFIFIILHYFWSNRPTALIFLIAILTVQFHNGIYHFLPTIFGFYSPGVISGFAVYIPLNSFFLLLAYRENYINKISGVIILLVSGVLYWIYYLVIRDVIIIFF